MGDWPISSVVIVPPGHDTIYVSGQTASGPGIQKTGNTEEQTIKALTTIKKLLEAQGLTMGDVVQMHVYLVADENQGRNAASNGTSTFDRAGMQAAYLKFFGTPEQPNKPARSTMQVAGLGDGALVEIDVVAVRKR